MATWREILAAWRNRSDNPFYVYTHPHRTAGGWALRLMWWLALPLGLLLLFLLRLELDPRFRNLEDMVAPWMITVLGLVLPVILIRSMPSLRSLDFWREMRLSLMTPAEIMVGLVYHPLKNLILIALAGATLVAYGIGWGSNNGTMAQVLFIWGVTFLGIIMTGVLAIHAGLLRGPLRYLMALLIPGIVWCLAMFFVFGSLAGGETGNPRLSMFITLGALALAVGMWLSMVLRVGCRKVVGKAWPDLYLRFASAGALKRAGIPTGARRLGVAIVGGALYLSVIYVCVGSLGLIAFFVLQHLIEIWSGVDRISPLGDGTLAILWLLSLPSRVALATLVRKLLPGGIAVRAGAFDTSVMWMVSPMVLVESAVWYAFAMIEGALDPIRALTVLPFALLYAYPISLVSFLAAFAAKRNWLVWATLFGPSIYILLSHYLYQLGSMDGQGEHGRIIGAAGAFIITSVPTALLLIFPMLDWAFIRTAFDVPVGRLTTDAVEGDEPIVPIDEEDALILKE